MTKNRLEAFSDGVIAIIITIMVLELKVPHGTDWNTIKSILPGLAGYLMSFIFIGTYWGNHHHLLHTIHRVNSKIILANLHLLFWLSLVPFATAWMDENNFEPLTVSVYAGLFLLCGFAYNILRISLQQQQVNHPKLIAALKKHEKKGIISMIAYASAIPLAFVHPAISGFLILAIAVMWFIPDRDVERALENEEG